MKQVISDNSNYRVLAQVETMDYPSDTVALRFTSQFVDAADADAEQHKFTLFMNSAERARLRELLSTLP